MSQAPAFWRWPALEADTGLSRWTLRRMAERGEFPRAQRLSPGTVAVPNELYQAWKAARTQQQAAA